MSAFHFRFVLPWHYFIASSAKHQALPIWEGVRTERVDLLVCGVRLCLGHMWSNVEPCRTLWNIIVGLSHRSMKPSIFAISCKLEHLEPHELHRSSARRPESTELQAATTKWKLKCSLVAHQRRDKYGGDHLGSSFSCSLGSVCTFSFWPTPSRNALMRLTPCSNTSNFCRSAVSAIYVNEPFRALRFRQPTAQ